MTGPSSASAPVHDHDTGLRTEELDFAGQFLLWGMRAWLLAFRQGRDRPNAYRGIASEGFALAVLLRDVGPMLAPLDAEKCAAPDLRIALAQASAVAPIH